MKKKDSWNAKRIRNLLIVCSLIIILILAATYAWFVGMQAINISGFSVEIASTNGLLLSLNGRLWDTTVSISKDTLDQDSYPDHTNTWGGAGLKPVSTIGEMDNTSSRLKLYEKTSLMNTKGGYRLLSSQINNLAKEQDGYLVFDLFIKNLSGTDYNTEWGAKDEEAIYLLSSSEVGIGSAGRENTGIENSVRVAFAQVGRVVATTTNPYEITGITCSSNSLVTGICRTAQIWEPNDTAHVANAISWYNKSCSKRTGADVLAKGSYNGNCKPITDGKGYDTYVVSGKITSDDGVNIYDGEDYNGYSSSGSKLKAYNCFTDSDKIKTGTDRPTFMTLAPNSITKVRVYVYIEGQDIDNYEYSMIGKMVSVGFGFTKQRFVETDIEYDGPDLDPTSTDKEKPVITLIGDDMIIIKRGTSYVDQGATALDNVDGNITHKIKTINPVNVNKLGTYYIAYDVVDEARNYAARVTRIVIVED